MKVSLAKSNRKGEKGQSLVEISLVTPLLLAALMVVVDFGIAFYMGNIIAVAARDGARIGSQLEKSGGTATNPDFASSNATKVRDYVQNRIPDYLTGRQIVVTFFEDDPGIGPPPCSESIEVQVSGNYPFTLYRMMRFFGFTVDPSIPLTRRTQMRYSYQRSDQNVTCTTSPNVNTTYSIADA
jgi:hypothetical protein